MHSSKRVWLITGFLALTNPITAAEIGKSRLTLEAREEGSDGPLPCRIHLKDESGKAVRPPGLPFWRDHFVCSGRVEIDLPHGRYTFEVERGPEYQKETGTFTVAGTQHNVAVRLKRLVDMAGEGWWSGELHVHRALEEVGLHLNSEDLHVAPVMTWWNDQNRWAEQPIPERLLICNDENRCYHVMAGEDEREGGALLYFHLPAPLPIAGADREFPSPMKFLDEARRQRGVWVDVEKPFWWDVPVWLASGKVNSMGLANNHMCRDQMYEDEAWGKPRDATRLPAPLGNGYWTQEIYYHALNCGLRIPPSAGSASGVLPNPVGYNRVYVYLGKDFNYDQWWEGLRAGRSFVSNGPLLRCRANGQWPGHIFRSDAGQPLKIDLDATITSRDPITSIEILRNGEIVRTVPFAEWKRDGKLGTVTFNESGWFLVRTIVDNPRTFRFASSAPFYVEIGPSSRRISKASVRFFLDWVRERKARVALTNADQRREVLGYHDAAEKFWSDLAQRANAQ